MDKYDEAIAFLTANPEKITDAWFEPYKAQGGCLFQHCSATMKDSSQLVPWANQRCGCLTQIKGSRGNFLSVFVAETKELTEAIRADTRIPISISYINKDNLHVFAEWQRRMDKELNRSEPCTPSNSTQPTHQTGL